MENRRFILIALLGVVIFFIYQAWQDDQAAARAQLDASRPAVASPAAQPDSDLPPTAQAAPVAGADPGSGEPALSAPGEVIVVETDLYRVEISTHGGDLRRVELLGYAAEKSQQNKPLALLNDRDGYYFILQSGLAGQNRPLATHMDRYQAQSREYRLGDADTLEVPLELVGEGYRVRKVYRFSRGSYSIDLEHTLANDGAEPLSASSYARLQRTPKVVGKEPKFTHTFLGTGIYEQDGEKYRFRKHSFDDLDDDPIELSQSGGWAAMLQHYFVAAIIPPADQSVAISAKPGRNGAYQLQLIGPSLTVPPQGTQLFKDQLYIGPKLQTGLAEPGEASGIKHWLALDGLEHVAPGLELTVDYGILTSLAEPLFWLLNQLHRLIGNWGLSIIALTLLVKAAFYKLSEAQYRSMARMRKFAPRIQEIKERHEGDRERQSKAMMELYKKEGFNPLAGCWPLLVQMPVFFSLYWVLLESVELRQAYLGLWVTDLSAPDPWFVLPVLFAASMWFQQRLSGQTMTMDPMQQRVMNVMPIAMGGFFMFFPAGLVLYWVVSNAVGIAQQWYITRKLEREGLGRSAPA